MDGWMNDRDENSSRTEAATELIFILGIEYCLLLELAPLVHCGQGVCSLFLFSRNNKGAPSLGLRVM